MTHLDAITLALGIHGSTLLVAVGAYYKYGDRSEMFERSLAGTDNALRRLRRDLADRLAARLERIFAASVSVPSPLVDANGVSYKERPVNPVQSESYREGFREFIESNAQVILDYRSLLMCRDRWCRHAKLLSWAVLLLFVWQALTLAVLAIGVKLAGLALPDWAVKASVIPTIILTILCVAQVPFLLWFHDHILDSRKKYDAP